MPLDDHHLGDDLGPGSDDHSVDRGHAHHDHGVAPGADRRYLRWALALLVAFLVAEVVVAVLVHSLVLLSDAGHMLSDVGALGAALWAMHLAARPAQGAWTFGWHRAEILSAAANGVTLLVVSGVVTVEAVQRLAEPGPVHGPSLLLTALAGVAVNLAATWVLAKANRSSLNVEGAFQHLLTDLYGFAATAVAGVVIMATGWTRADPGASLVVVVLMLRAAWGLLRDSGRILLEAAPKGFDLEQVRAHLLESDHVHDVHDLHVWTVTSRLPALSAHVVIDDSCFRDGHAPQLLDQLQACLQGHFDVEHSTFQLEPVGHDTHEGGTH